MKLLAAILAFTLLLFMSPGSSAKAIEHRLRPPRCDVYKPCPRLYCPNGQYTPPYSCCPICRPIKRGCPDGADGYVQVGHSIRRGCKTCRCPSDGAPLSCKPVKCVRYKCRFGLYKPLDSCCYICKPRYGYGKLYGSDPIP